VCAKGFEGIEKKLEIIFKSGHDLRMISNARIKKMVKITGASILSKINTEKLDAYLLSESSLFVWSDRILMITCGQTTLLKAVPEILSFVNRDDISYLFYERKNFLYPKDQPSDFEAEVKYLEKFFKGKSYRFGPANGEHTHLFYSYLPTAAPPPNDITFQILMRGLDRDVKRKFIWNQSSAEKADQVIAKIEKIYPKMLKDIYYFKPFGYSLNSISEKNYFTVHITPQSDASYASFESNIPQNNYAGIITKVTSVFKPENFCAVLTESKDKSSFSLYKSTSDIKCYKIEEKSFHEFDCGYSLTFLRGEKN
jgi:S-adenosylmethionine decarboxylase